LPNADTHRNGIMEFLKNFSDTYSFGLPVGGPAARLLAELTLNQIDRLLFQKKVKFCRFADDFYLFSQTESESFKSLVFLSEILHRNQGLQLQKSKTRLMSSAEFVATNPLNFDQELVAPNDTLSKVRQSLFSISLHFDPYSATADQDYESLKEEIDRFPILDLIKAELLKSRVNVTLARKLVGTLRFIEREQLNDAARTLIENEDLLYPIYFNVLAALKSAFDDIDMESQDHILSYVRELVESSSPVMAVDLNLHYAVRLLSCKRSEETVSLLSRLYDSLSSSAIRRDIILAMARWKEWIWLSDKRGNFRAMNPSERRAFIIASYVMKDEGDHWRKHTRKEFSAFEEIVRAWASSRFSIQSSDIPL
jgi:hypothetical protein